MTQGIKGPLILLAVCLSVAGLAVGMPSGAPGETPEYKVMHTINSFYSEPVCTDVVRIKTIRSEVKGWDGAQYVSCKLGRYVIKANGGIVPDYCGRDIVPGCWPVYCVGSAKDKLPDRDRQLCSTLPRRLLEAGS